MKTGLLLRTLVMWLVTFFPVWAGAEDLGALRLSQMEGDVQVQSKGGAEWLPAAINLPVRAGDRLWVPKGAWAQVETREGSVIRLDADTALEILAVGKDSLQVYLSQGQAYLNFMKFNDAMFQVDTPVASLRIYDSSTLNVALVNKEGKTEISVFRGAVYAENRSGEVRIPAGKMLSMDDGLPTLMVLGPPSDWERWNRDWDESLAGGEESEQYLPEELSGYSRDLNRNGRWVSTTEYGHVWTPTTFISVDWAPYRHGRWVWIGDDYVWIGREPWGWAPYHYGRWAHVSSHGWCWVPPRRHEVYWGPGYVSWVQTTSTVAWVPLAPREVYYGHGDYGPHSVNIVNVHNYNVIQGNVYQNVHVNNAVTVVNRNTFLTGRQYNVEHQDNPFLREPIHIGRPRIEPERITKMPIIKDIATENQPPVHIRTMPGPTGDGQRKIIRERDRSVFTPTAPPQPLTPAVRMSPEPAVKPLDGQGTPGAGDRQQMLEHSVMPGQDRGGPAMNRENVQGTTAPPSVKTEPDAPPLPVREQPAPEGDKETSSPFRGRPQMPDQFRGKQTMDTDNIQPQVAPPVPVREKPVPEEDKETSSPFRGHPQMPDQFRGKPTMDTDNVRPVNPPVHIQPQVAPPVPVREKPAPQEDKGASSPFRGQPQMPDQFRGKPAMDTDNVRPVNPPVHVQPQVAPPVPVREKPAPQEDKEASSPFRGQPQMPDQFRGKPAMDTNNIRPAQPPVHVQPQVAPPPAPPAPVQGQPGQPDPEALKRLQQQIEEEKKRQQEAGGQGGGMPPGQRSR